MTVMSWILFSLFFWLTGFINTTINEPDQLIKFISLVRVPRILFILFGTPKNRKFPNGIQPVRSVFLQSIGLVFLVYGLFIDKHFIKDPTLSALFGFGISLLIGNLVARWLYRRKPYVLKSDSLVENDS